jgi:hypothetical protein
MNIKVNDDTAEFKSWFAEVVKRDAAYMAEHFNSLPANEFRVNFGTRYVRVMRGTSAHAFIDRSNGDVLKPATWKAPAKHARGNIFDASNGLGSMGPYGPAYLK